MATPIWTLEARSNVALDVISSYFDLTHPQMQAEILGAHGHTVELLAKKGIDYRKLRNALTPQRDKRELALLFDSKATGNDSWYGLPVYERILGALPTKGFSCSILSGDLLIDNQGAGFALLEEGVQLHREVRRFGHTGELFGIYINNLSPSRADALRQQLEPWEGYVGYVDCTYSSPMKDWLATTLVASYVKHGKVFIGEHEAGYQLVSIPSMYYGIFLTYKIERRTLSGETDTLHSLNAISTTPEELDDYSVIIEDDRKHEYVVKHGGGLHIAGLENITRQQLEQEIRDKLSMSYVYSMESKEHTSGVTDKFNVMLEFTSTSGKSVRLAASLEYQPRSRTLRLINLF